MPRVPGGSRRSTWWFVNDDALVGLGEYVALIWMLFLRAVCGEDTRDVVA